PRALFALSSATYVSAVAESGPFCRAFSICRSCHPAASGSVRSINRLVPQQPHLAGYVCGNATCKTRADRLAVPGHLEHCVHLASVNLSYNKIADLSNVRLAIWHTVGRITLASPPLRDSVCCRRRIYRWAMSAFSACDATRSGVPYFL